ncbi:MAG TPA: hypothetical protein VFP96_17240 [Candidatus Acidoferrum sp.]|nr:hypothetical protein [Candidatus Acidoferrum sp.]
MSVGRVRLLLVVGPQREPMIVSGHPANLPDMELAAIVSSAQSALSFALLQSSVAHFLYFQ